MTDLAHHDRRTVTGSRDGIEARLMFGVCFVFFLTRALVSRLVPHGKAGRERFSMWREASTAASVLVASAFMGL